ncbi:uncharacterized protein TNCV_173341 [Trichonephila clavipes]|nr:uncharacterized protein TNCV_173341 [Trichonephila clavipes]
MRPKVTVKPKVRDIWGNFSCVIWENVDITDYEQSIPGFQECDEDVETWRACDADDCGFQMLNDDEIVTSVQAESDPSRR